MSKFVDIAIIGLAGAYAGAGHARRFWQNILDKVDAVGEAEPGWAGPYFDPSAKSNDRIYTTRGGFLRQLAEVDPGELGVMPNMLDGGEPDHMLALRFARDALADAGYLTKPMNRERVGIVLGRGTYANRGLMTFMQHGLIIDQTMAIIEKLRPDFDAGDLAEMRRALKAQVPPYTAEMVGLLTPNVIAGLIANRLDLMGPNYIIDAACASSLVAVELASREIASGRCDMMLSGGVQAQCPPQLYMQFCQIGGLSRGQLRPFSKGSTGTLLGEGVGVLVLKRLDLAEADGDRIYAVIKGIGTASDGKAKGLLTPRLEGEVLALRRAYESSGIDPATIGLIEAHGTGTPVGDKTEIESLTTLFGKRRGDLPTISLGSVKSMISHCLPAAGSASIIKTALALHHKVLPPMLVDEVDPALELEHTPFYLNTEARPWIHGLPTPRRAGINAFGFGGINAHVILEEYRPKPGITVPVAGILHVPGHSELITLAADTAPDLAALARQLLAQARGPARPSLPMLARASSQHAVGEHRLAIVASDVDDLITRLEQALAKLEAPNVAPFRIRAGVHYGRGAMAGKLCFVFPGEGSQYPNMLADLCLSFPQIREWFDFIEETAVRRGSRLRSPIVFPAPNAIDEATRKRLEDDLYEMDIAAENVFAAGIGLNDLLADLGFAPDAMLGHSTGENTALIASGVRRYDNREEIADTVRDLNRIYRELDREGRIVEGSLLTIGALKPELRSALLAAHRDGDGPIRVAMDNCPNQLVLFGTRFDIARLKDELSTQGAICAELPFGRAYHTALFKPVADAYREYYAELGFGPGRTTLYSARSMAPFPVEDAADIRELACQQWECPVRFTETIERLYADGYRVFLEVGPSGNLTSFISDTLRAKADVVALSTNSRRKPGVAHLQQTLAQLFALGVPFAPQALFHRREIEPLALRDAPPPAPRQKPRLKLEMPIIVAPDTIKPLPRIVETVVRDVPVPAATPNPAPTPAPAAQVPAVLAMPADPRLDALKSHFALMQDFLDSQARVLGALTGDAVPLPGPAGVAAIPTTVAVQPGPAASPVEPDRPDPSRFPLLGRVTERGERHLVCERRYTLVDDNFLLDHTIGSAPSAQQPSLPAFSVIPFTFSMEIVAEGAALLAGDALKVVGMRDVRGHRWLGLDDQTISIRLRAERLEASADGEQRVMVRLFQLGIGGPPSGVLVFEAEVRLAAQYPAPPPVRAWTAAESRPPVVNDNRALYAQGMFHGPRLQGVKGIRRWADEAIETDMATIGTQDYFAFTRRPQFRIDPALLDAAGQVAGYWLTERYTWGFNCFPYHLGDFRQYADPLPAGSAVVCRGDLRLVDDLRLQAHFDLFDGDGRLLMRAQDWDDRKFAVPDRYYQFRMRPQTGYMSEPISPLPHLAGSVQLARMPAFEGGFLDSGFSIWKRVLAHSVLSPPERAHFYSRLPAAGPARERWLEGRIAAKDAVRRWLEAAHGKAVACADVVIDETADGHPFLAGIVGASDLSLPAISIASGPDGATAACAPPGTAVGLGACRYDAIDVAAPLAAADRERWIASVAAEQRTGVAAALIATRLAAAAIVGADAALAAGAQIEQFTVGPTGSRHAQARIVLAGHALAAELHLGGSEALAVIWQAVEQRQTQTHGR